MKKDAYLAIPEVSQFIKWFASNGQTLPHSYYSKDMRKKCSFQSLSDALIQYYWPYKPFLDCRGTLHKCQNGSLDESTRALNMLQNDLGVSVNSNFDNYKASAKALMSWGGTTYQNNDWFDNQNNWKIVHNTIEVFNKNDDDLVVLKSIEELRFNAGLTKLYSLILEDFIIYDSRVAAALAWFVLKFKDEMNMDEIPLLLRFPCMPAKNGQTRNPLPNRKAGFTGVNNNDAKHAHWNIRANWILEAAIKLMPNSSYYSKSHLKPIRALEAALFMWGYDLNNTI